MKFFAVLSSALAASFVFSKATANDIDPLYGTHLKIHPDFLSEEKIDFFSKIETKFPGTDETRRHGRVHLSPDFIEELHGTVGEELPEHLLGRKAEVKTTLITKTTVPHEDGIYDLDGTYLGHSESQNAFVFLNTNEKAHFLYGDLKVPIKAGNMVIFRGGDAMHHTIVDEGVVHLLGPFELRSLKFVQSCNGYCDDCPVPCAQTPSVAGSPIPLPTAAPATACLGNCGSNGCNVPCITAPSAEWSVLVPIIQESCPEVPSSAPSVPSSQPSASPTKEGKKGGKKGGKRLFFGKSKGKKL